MNKSFNLSISSCYYFKSSISTPSYPFTLNDYRAKRRSHLILEFSNLQHPILLKGFTISSIRHFMHIPQHPHFSSCVFFYFWFRLNVGLLKKTENAVLQKQKSWWCSKNLLQANNIQQKLIVFWSRAHRYKPV